MRKITNSSKIDIVIAFIIFLTAFLIAFQNLNKYAIAGDEPFSIFVSQFNIPSIWNFLLEGNNPPLYETFMHIWTRLFGISPIAVRLPSVICFALTCTLLFRIGNKYFDRSIGICAALLLCFSNLAIYISQEGRVYALLMFLTSLSFYFLLKHLKEGLSIFGKFCYLGVLVFLLYAHYLSAFVIFSQLLIATIIFFLSSPDKAKQLFYLQFAAIVLFSPLLFNFIKHTKNYHATSWLGKPDGFHDFVRVLKIFFNNYDTMLVSLSGFFLFLLIVLIKRSVFPIQYVLVTIAWSVFSYTLNYIVSFRYPVWGERYTLFIVPGLYLLVSIIVLGLVEHKRMKLVLAFVIPSFLLLKLDNGISNGREIDRLVNTYRQLKTDSTISFLCPEYAEITFSFHYDSSIFRSFSNDSVKISNYSSLVRQKLNQRGIYPIRTALDIDSVKLNQFKRVVYIDYLADFNNANNGVRSLIESRFRLLHTYAFWENLRIFEYIR